jgi:hypothetical protein
VNDQETIDLLHEFGYVCRGIRRDGSGALRTEEVRSADNLDSFSEYEGVPPNLLALHSDDERLVRLVRG